MRHRVAKAAAAGSFSPTDIAGLELWLDASDVGTITDAGGGSVSAWADKSGLSRNATQGTAGSQPTTGAGSINGLNALSFDGGDSVVTGSVTLAQPHTVAAVGYFNDPGTGSYYLCGQSGTSDRSQVGSTGGSWVMRNGGTNKTNGTDAARSVLLVAEFNGASSALRVDGSSSAGTVGTNGWTGGISIGSGWGGGWQGLIGEFLIYNSILGASDLSDLETYLRTKWGTP